jgi:sulfur carrier protein
LEVIRVVRINGENLDIVGKSVAEYLNSAGYDLMRVAVELNGDVVSKAQYSDTVFKDGDSVEVVSFVGGG